MRVAPWALRGILMAALFGWGAGCALPGRDTVPDRVHEGPGPASGAGEARGNGDHSTIDGWAAERTAKVIRGRKFELVHEDGSVLGELGILEAGGRDLPRQPVLRLSYPGRDTLLEVTASGLSIRTLEGRTRLRLSLDPVPAFCVYDAGGNEVLRMAWEEGGGVVTVTGVDGVRREFPAR